MSEIEQRIDQHLNHRLSFRTFFKEVYAHFTDKVIPQGADEAANALFNQSAYLPWPGTSGPAPVEAPPFEPEPNEPNNFDKHAALYGASYTDQLEQSSRRGHNHDQGHTR